MSDNDNGAVLELYRLTVRDLLAGSRPGIVPNSSYRHATVILEELIRSAKKSFYAFCGRLSDDVWTSSVTALLCEAVKRGVQVRIVVAEIAPAAVPLAIRENVRVLDPVIARNKAVIDSTLHFAVVDGKSLRLERNRKTREALFAANHPEIASELESIFGILFDKAKAAAA